MATRLLFLFLFILTASSALGGSEQVLVVVNERSQSSKEVGRYYAARRRVPPANICRISIAPDKKAPLADFRSKIRKPILDHIRRHKLTQVDYIVTTRGVPLMDERGFSVDSLLTRAAFGTEKQMNSPYFGRYERFDSGKFHMYLVTRLDGYSTSDAKALVDRSLKAQGKRGKFLLDIDPGQDRRKGYVELNQDIRAGVLGLMERNIPYVLESTDEFAGGHSGLMGYYSWGSNDLHFSRKSYLSNRFVPGAIGETIVSTSARSFVPETGGQSQIGDLIKIGITGVKGYTTEPYGTSMAKAHILFDRYTRGFNLAESFYMASPFICWKDVVIGDPLCAPYAAGR